MASAQLLVSLHHGFRNKPAAERFGLINDSSPWIPAELDALALIDHISAGKAWIACKLAAASSKREEDLAGDWNLIVLDVDGDMPLEQFWANPFVARHCLFSYTTPSHQKVTEKNPEALDRFRAIFHCGSTLSGIELHRQLYALLIERSGLVLKDNCGDKPERLWYGYDQAEIRTGDGTPLSWDLIEDAKDAAANEEAAEAQRAHERAHAGPTDDKDIERAAYLLRHVLKPSGLIGDGTDGYESYWIRVLNAAASAGALLFEPFMEWSSKGGHHKDEARRLQRGKRWDRAGRRSGVAALFAMAKEQLGPNWTQALPAELRPSSGTQPPQIIYSHRPATETDPPRPFDASKFRPPGLRIPDPDENTHIPDAVTAQDLKAIAEDRRIFSAPRPKDAEPKSDKDKPESQELSIDEQLNRLYHLRAHGLIQDGDELIAAPQEKIDSLDRAMLSDLLEHKGYVNSPGEVERDLLSLFRREHGMVRNSHQDCARKTLDGKAGPKVRWLVDNFIMAGREHIIHAKAGAGKTVLACHLARAITGDPTLTSFLDSGFLNGASRWKRDRVIFIATDMGEGAEENTNTYLDRLHMAGLPFLEQVEWWLQDAESGKPPWTLSLHHITRLIQYLEGMQHQGTPVAAVIIDSMKAVCPEHMQVGNQAFKAYLDLIADICSRFGTSLIWIHHTSGDGSRAQGIQRISEGAGAVFRLEKQKDSRQILLSVEKIRGGAKSRDLLIDPFAVDGLTFSYPQDADQGDAPDPVFQEEDRRKTAVLDVLRRDYSRFRLDHPELHADKHSLHYLGLSKTQIQDAIDGAPCSEKQLRNLLADLADGPLIEKKGHGKATTYRLRLDGIGPQLSTGDIFTDLGP
ncbi:AAA family ATPase [Cyanobium sp. NS01]|uniref:AAA family ATPase n=1 Tax=Cyanobium sp. NS01 TaxID=261284 RepID=UPI001646954E|nr:AAA family ATPase [Cyanobium sp. NS01]